MWNLKSSAIIGLVAIGLIVSAYFVGHLKGYGKGKAYMVEKIEEARKESQERINLEAGKNAELQQRIDALQNQGPVEVVKYVRSRGADPDCVDNDGLQLLERYREYPSAPVK